MTTLTETIEGKRLITGEELQAMNDVGPCELVEGEIIPMTPTSDAHGAIEKNVGYELEKYVRAHKTGYVRVGEVGVYVSRNPDTVRGADAVFISEERYAGQTSPGFLEVAPDLVVEILSPSDTWARVNKKLHEYFNLGVKMVWIIDATDPQVYVYRSITTVRYLTADDKIPGDEILPGLDLPVNNLYQ
jgi:Uma2 family endonuclease